MDDPRVERLIRYGGPFAGDLVVRVTSAEIEAACHELGFLHVTSHVSDPLPAAAAAAVLEIVREDDLPARAGERLAGHLAELALRHDQIDLAAEILDASLSTVVTHA